MRLFRLFRVLKLARYSESLQTFIDVLRLKKEELVLMFFAILILLVISSSLVYEAEHEAQPEALRFHTRSHVVGNCDPGHSGLRRCLSPDSLGQIDRLGGGHIGNRPVCPAHRSPGIRIRRGTGQEERETEKGEDEVPSLREIYRGAGRLRRA